MRIALAQIDTTVGDICGNRDRVYQEMDRAGDLAADLIVFPELCLTGYPPRDLLGLSGFVGANLRVMMEIASRTGRMGVVLGYVDRNTSGGGKELFNAAALLAEGKVQGVAHKMLLPTYDVFDEDRYFERGRESCVVLFKGVKIGLSICEDAWNSEGFWPKRLYRTDPIRNLAENGANLLLNVSASPYEMDKPQFRYQMLLDHARRNAVPLLYVNLVGGNDDLIFDGNSIALGKSGNLIAQGKSFEEDLLIVDPEDDSDRPYCEGESIENLFNALVLGTRDYARKCGFHSAVLGLSGGIDSAVTANIAAEAFGPANVIGVSMPSVYSADESLEDACSLARNLGIRFEVIPIQPLVQEYRQLLSGIFSGLSEDTTEENLQARVRGNLLMALSNKFGNLVLSTGNKSELAVGYCTLYGDMAGGLAVISDVPKTVVYKLADFINRRGEIIPRRTIERPPTAELRPNQTDQDTLPDYAVLDGILRLHVELQMGVDEIVSRGYDPAIVREVVNMIQRTEYKRRQAAPGLKVTSRAFGTGRRIPIASRLSLPD
jgi:NAD+ synthetase